VYNRSETKLGSGSYGTVTSAIHKETG